MVVVFGLSIDAFHQPFRWRWFWLPRRHFLVVYYSFDNMFGEATIHLSVVDSFVVVSFLVCYRREGGGVRGVLTEKEQTNKTRSPVPPSDGAVYHPERNISPDAPGRRRGSDSQGIL